MINIKHGNNPEAELFLCEDGVIFLSCVDVLNRHMGGGWSILGSEVWFLFLFLFSFSLSLSHSLTLTLTLFLSHSLTLRPYLHHPHQRPQILPLRKKSHRRH